MDILQQEVNKNNNENNSKKKKILNLLIICVVLLVLAIIGRTIIKSQPVKKELTIEVDGQNVPIEQNLLINSEGKQYISLEKISKYINYSYTRGGYLEYAENDNKCYLEGTNQIIGFEADSKKIYKTNKNSQTDYMYFSLKNNILKNDNQLYISLDDLNVGLNVVYSFIEEDNIISIETCEYIIDKNQEAFAEKSFSISKSDFKNNKAICYGLLVVTEQPKGEVGVIDFNMINLIGCKYSTIEFDEYSQNFIASKDGKYGIISKEGNPVVELIYDGIEIINYSPLLYKVKNNNQYGVIDKNGKQIVNIDYKDIGIKNQTDGGKIIIIEDAVDDEDVIVVSKDGKYGLVDLKTQREIVDCVIDNIYYTKEDDNKQYYVQINNQEAKLDEYINYVKTLIVNLD